jgi:hypothetical protein
VTSGDQPPAAESFCACEKQKSRAREGAPMGLRGSVRAGQGSCSHRQDRGRLPFRLKYYDGRLPTAILTIRNWCLTRVSRILPFRPKRFRGNVFWDKTLFQRNARGRNDRPDECSLVLDVFRSIERVHGCVLRPRRLVTRGTCIARLCSRTPRLLVTSRPIAVSSRWGRGSADSRRLYRGSERGAGVSRGARRVVADGRAATA